MIYTFASRVKNRDDGVNTNTTTAEQVVDQICKLAKKGATPSQIGVVLRDSHGVAQVKHVTGMFLSLSTSGEKKKEII
jgi:hypothetical protein